MIYAHEKREKKPFVGPRPGFPVLSLDLLERMNTYLSQRNLNYSLARTNGWYPAHYKDAQRIVIPCTNSAGVPYFQARDMSGKAALRYASPAASRDDSIVLVWPLGKVRGTVVVEGPMCALAVADLGFLGIALMGNQPPISVLRQVANFARSFPMVLIAPDADTPEMGAELVSWLAQAGLPVFIKVPEVKDIGDMSIAARRRFLGLDEDEETT